MRWWRGAKLQKVNPELLHPGFGPNFRVEGLRFRVFQFKPTYSQPCRLLPVVLPHHLLIHLYQNDLLPLSRMDVHKYWDHMRNFATWGSDHPAVQIGGVHVPVYLYGDDTRFSHQEKLTAVTLGFVLDDRTSSMETHYPLFLIREVPWLKFGQIKAKQHLLWLHDYIAVVCGYEPRG